MADCYNREHKPNQVSVTAWLRPAGAESIGKEPPFSIDQQRGTVLDLQIGDAWRFDHAFAADARAGTVYAACGGNLVDRFLSGCNRDVCHGGGCILAYGQRSASNTPLMFGIDGLVSCAMRSVFAGLEAKVSTSCNRVTRKPSICISFLEVCDGQIKDLLEDCEVSILDPHHDIALQDLGRVEVTCEEDVMECIARGEQQRRSSRSHGLLLLKLEQPLGQDASEDVGSDREEQCVQSQLMFADLAAGAAQEQDDLLIFLAQLLKAKAEENSASNQELFDLGTSKLACMLQPWLPSSVHAAIVCTVSLEEADHEENRKALCFAASLIDRDSQEGTVDADQVPALMSEVYWEKEEEEDVDDLENDEELAYEDSIPCTPGNAASPCRDRTRRHNNELVGFGLPSQPSTPQSGLVIPPLGLPINGELLTPGSPKAFPPASPPLSASWTRRSSGRPSRQPRQGSEPSEASPQGRGNSGVGRIEPSMDLTEVLNELRRLCEESQARTLVAEERANAEHLRAERMLQRLKEVEAVPRRSEGCGICPQM
mmetsp:Transcript_104629/g.207791  ORF Transcript_104629/g.207791 Transcript_104629/m.207791 type:complete len:541 (+) Transcript_104629:79-1701(+)